MADKKEKRQHKATYSKNKHGAGYLVRVVGPYAGRFAGKEVPVTKMDDSENVEKLESIVWAGIDEGNKTAGIKGTGQPVALYNYEQKPFNDDIAF